MTSEHAAWLVGVDAGGTHTRALALNPETGEQHRAEGEGANWTVHGPELCRTRLQQVISAVLPENSAPAALCLCVAGYYPPDHRESVEPWIREVWPHVLVRVEPDVVGAWAGAFGGEAGIVLISGTGSICYGRNSRGEEARAGGWGPLFGDEGSAYALGLSCLQRLTHVADGICPASTLPERALQAFPGLGTDLRSWLRGVYRAQWGREEIAALAPLVVAAADEGDKQAAFLVAARCPLQLARMVRAVALKLDCEALPLALHGGLLRSSPRIVSGLWAPLEEEQPRLVRPAEPRFDATQGAVLLAAEARGGPELRVRMAEALH